MELHDFYHPSLANPVTNSFSTSGNVVLLTGPNMSGKSTLLKAIGFCAYLGQIGVAVPASSALIPLYSNVSISINHRDDIKNGYSHFMMDMINLKKVIVSASSGKSNFAVFDELFNGTNVEDALEISTITIKGLSKFKNSLFFISTHLQDLNKLINFKEYNISTYYIDCELKENLPKFSYKLKKGLSEIRVGKILFEKEGLHKMLT